MGGRERQRERWSEGGQGGRRKEVIEGTEGWLLFIILSPRAIPHDLLLTYARNKVKKDGPRDSKVLGE